MRPAGGECSGDDNTSASSSGGEEEEEDQEQHRGNGLAGGSGDGGDAPGGDKQRPAARAGPTAAPAARDAARAAEQAVLSGELSAQAALLQLQLSDLLSEVAACRAPRRRAAVDQLVAQLSEALAALPRQTLAGDDPRACGGLISSWGLDPQDFSLGIRPPVAVQLVGSWALDAAAQLPGGAVDVAVQIPTRCFHNKDILNYRYHAKRLQYLSALSSWLSGHEAFGAAQQLLSPLHGDPLRPALLLHLAPAAAARLLARGGGAAGAAAAAAVFGEQGVVLRLLPVVGLDTFDLTKLAPDRNNVRWAVDGKAGSAGGGSNQQQQQDRLLPTPHYNAGVLHDALLLLGQQRLQQAAAAGGPRWVDALLLLKVWAQRCGLAAAGSLPADTRACYGAAPHGRRQQQEQQQQQQQLPPALAAAAAEQADGLSGFLLASILQLAAHRAGSAAAAMSPLQQLRCALQLLADRQVWAKGLALPHDAAVPVELRLLAEQEQLREQQHGGGGGGGGAAAGKTLSKDQARLQQKLSQQLQRLPAGPAAGPAAFRGGGAGGAAAAAGVLLGADGLLNLAAPLSRSGLALAQLLARRSLEVLSRQDLEAEAAFSAVFGAGQAGGAARGPAAAFDYWWTVELPQAHGGGRGGQEGKPGDQHAMRLAEERVEGLVRKALTTRAVLVRALRRPASVLPAPPAAPAALCVPRRIVIGAIADPLAALRVVDVGPPADDTGAAGKFRALWGDKSELRRFPDGRICEAVVWEGVPPGERHTVPDLAVSHLLLRHLPPGTVVQCCSAALDSLLYSSAAAAAGSGGKRAAREAAAGAVSWALAAPQGGAPASAAVAVGAGAGAGAAAAETAASRAADAALDSLSKQLRGLADVALKVVGVQPLSAVSRHTPCFFPAPHPLAQGGGGGAGGAAAAAALAAGGAKVPRVLEPIDVMVQLEGSGRMPSDPAAFAKMKAALGAQLAGALGAACGAAVTATEEAVEVLWKGFAFKLLLFMDRDNPMHSAAVAGAPGGASPAGAHTPLPLLLSQHHGLVSALEAAHAAYSPTVRLAKRWLGLQLLLGPSQMAPEAVELLVGAVFQGPSATPPPASRTSGLLSFLRLLASHPWAAAPLLVDPSGEVGPEARRALQKEFEARRAAGTLPGLFIAAPYDLHSSRWTAHRPSPAVAHHLVSLARAALQQLSQLVLLGPDAPPAMLQLGGGGGHGDEQQEQQEQQVQQEPALEQLCRQEMAALARAWRAACGPSLGGFDAWVVLRREAVPFAERADPLALQQLELLLELQRRRRQQLLDQGRPPGANKPRKRQKVPGGQRGGGGSDGDGDDSDGDNSDDDDSDAGRSPPHPGAAAAVRALLAGPAEAEPPKAARAVLRSIPEQVLRSTPPDKLRAELLVGFDPVNRYAQLCTERYGHLAAFCADAAGGFPAVGVKWRAEAFLPAPLRPAHAHGSMEVGLTAAAAAGGRRGKGGGHAGLVVPNVAQVLSELAQLGLGLVQGVVLVAD